MRKIEPRLSGVVERIEPLERTLKLRELQTSYVYTTVLAKKCRVSPLPELAAMIASCAHHSCVNMGGQGPDGLFHYNVHITGTGYCDAGGAEMA